MRATLLATALVLLGTGANASTSCDQAALNSRLTINVQSQNQSIPKTLEVTSCENGTYVAKEVGSSGSPVVMQIKPKYSEFAEVSLTREGQGDDSFTPIASGRWYKGTNAISFQQPQPVCPPGQVWDPFLEKCVPINQPPPVECKEIGPQQCSEGCEWNPHHGMCMPIEMGKTNLNFHINQFFVTSSSSGPRGTTAFSAPNMWMLEVNRQVTPRNMFAVNFMGTTDKWTVPSKGYPLLLQSGESNAQGVPYVDAQHPHTSPVMGLTFSDIISLDADGKKKLTFFFAPRGEATAGPQAFMHRPSASINPDAPLAHHLQDVFHITSTVIGVKFETGNTTLETSVFSGVEPSPAEVTLDMHKPDSYAFRVNQKLNNNFSVGGSVAKMKSSHREGGGEVSHAEDEVVLNAWLSTSHMVKSGKLSTSFIWGQVTNKEEDRTLNGFLEEFVYQLGKNNFYGRVEILQRTPEQLNIEITDGKTGAKWIKPLTIGYERRLLSKNSLDVGLGGSVTKNFLPREFKETYGGNPYAGKVYLRISWGKSKSWK